MTSARARTFTGRELATRIPIPCRRDRFTDKHGPDGNWPTPEPPHRINQIFLEPILFAHAENQPRIKIFSKDCDRLARTQIAAAHVHQGVVISVTSDVAGVKKDVRYHVDHDAKDAEGFKHRAGVSLVILFSATQRQASPPGGTIPAVTVLGGAGKLSAGVRLVPDPAGGPGGRPGFRRGCRCLSAPSCSGRPAVGVLKSEVAICISKLTSVALDRGAIDVVGLVQ